MPLKDLMRIEGRDPPMDTTGFIQCKQQLVIRYLEDHQFHIVKNHKITYRKIPKISPGAYIFQTPFLRGLFFEGLIFGGAYIWREICVLKSIGLAL